MAAAGSGSKVCACPSCRRSGRASCCGCGACISGSSPKRLPSEAFFLYFRHFCVNVLLFVRCGQCLRLPEPCQCLGIAFTGSRLIRLFQQFFHFLPFFPDLLRFLFQWGFGALVLRRRLFRLFFECLQVGEDALRFLYGSADGLKKLRIQFLRSAVQYPGGRFAPRFRLSVRCGGAVTATVRRLLTCRILKLRSVPAVIIRLIA